MPIEVKKLTEEERENMIAAAEIHINEEEQRIADINNFLENEGIPHEQTMMEMVGRLEELERNLETNKENLALLKVAAVEIITF